MTAQSNPPHQTVHTTPEFLNKKHLIFGQGLEFLRFGQRNRDLNLQHRRTTKETARTNQEQRGNFDKKIRDRDSNLLSTNFLFAIFSVPAGKAWVPR